jgi:hypothetical protein
MRSWVVCVVLACGSSPEIRVRDMAMHELQCAQVGVEQAPYRAEICEFSADCTPHTYVAEGCGFSATYDVVPKVHRVGAIGPDHAHANAAWWAAFLDGGSD